MKHSVKIVVVGDGSCGKTSLIVAHLCSQFNEVYMPTAFDEFAVEGLVNGKQELVTISDTAGEEDFAAMRPLSYPDTDVFILTYSIDQPDSLKHLRKKWIPEIRRFCPATPILVVGNKKDLRDSAEHPANSLISTKEAADFVRQITNLPLIECSAKTRENVRFVFDSALAAVTAYRNRRKNKVIQSIMKLRLVF